MSRASTPPPRYSTAKAPGNKFFLLLVGRIRERLSPFLGEVMMRPFSRLAMRQKSRMDNMIS
eukprot:scaffold3304_cov154-Amphora_coffeaeformis.AAC.8